MARAKSKPVWDRAPPTRVKHTKLPADKKAAAKARAARAGRPYPNLVDNIRAAKKTSRSSRKRSSGKLSARKGAKS